MICVTPGRRGSRQNDVPTWVLQELGGWKSESMVRRYAHMSVKHLQPYADQLIFPDTPDESVKPLETLNRPGHTFGHSKGPSDAPTDRKQLA